MVVEIRAVTLGVVGGVGALGRLLNVLGGDFPLFLHILHVDFGLEARHIGDRQALAALVPATFKLVGCRSAAPQETFFKLTHDG